MRGIEKKRQQEDITDDGVDEFDACAELQERIIVFFVETNGFLKIEQRNSITVVLK